MWKSACVGIYQLLNWKMHGETLKNPSVYVPSKTWGTSSLNDKHQPMHFTFNNILV